MRHEELGILLAKFWHLEHSSSFKIDVAFLNFKWAGQAQFLSHILQIFKIYITFEENLMILYGLLIYLLVCYFKKIPTSSMSSNRGVLPYSVMIFSEIVQRLQSISDSLIFNSIRNTFFTIHRILILTEHFKYFIMFVL